jgi:hypothetical protein
LVEVRVEGSVFPTKFLHLLEQFLGLLGLIVLKGEQPDDLVLLLAQLTVQFL